MIQKVREPQFDCPPHNIIIAKLNAYGFSLDSSAYILIHNYLSNRKRRTRTNTSYGSWEEILFVVPKGSILGPILFHIFMCDLFSILRNTEFASHADDNTLYVIGKNAKEAIESVEFTSNDLME